MDAGIGRVEQYFYELKVASSKMPFGEIEKVIDLLMHACELGNSLYLFGNGGSAALAAHLACDLGKGIAHYSPGPRFRAISMVDNAPTLTAWANDTSYADVFAEQLSCLARRDDIALGISGSGNSPNILRALQVARLSGARTIGFTGFQGGRMKSLCDLCVIIPSENMQIIEDLHLSVAHTIFTVMVTRRKNSASSLAAARLY